jgi:site-specific DNA recombinase
MKAILVARVSTEEQREANNSLPAQVHRMEEYCARRRFQIVETYSFDESAYKEKRSEFDKILSRLDDFKNEKIAVCFDKVDRLSRDIFDKRVPLLYNKALDNSIELHFVSDWQVINSDMSAWDKFAFGMKLWLSKYYSDAISDNVKRTFREKRRRWEATWPAKLGYINTIWDDGRNTVIPDPERKHLIIRLFELYASWTHSMESLKGEMEKLGLRSKKWGKVWTSKIEDILKDSYYYGIAKSEKYWEYPHKYARLISKELFDRCQEVRKGKSWRPEKSIVNEDFVFGWVFRCNKCWCTITPEVKVKKSGKKFIYYSCTNAKHVCKREYINENSLLWELYPLLTKLSTITPEAQEFILSELRKTHESEVAFNKSQILRIEREIESAKWADENLLRKYCDPNTRITSEMYDKIHQEYQDTITRLEYEKQKYSEWRSEYNLSINTVFSLASRAKEIFESSEIWEKKLLLKFLLQNPMIDSKKPLFNLESPFDLVLDLDDSKKWLPWSSEGQIILRNLYSSLCRNHGWLVSFLKEPYTPVVPVEPKLPKVKPEKKERKKFSREDARALLESGSSYAEIGRIYGVSRSGIWSALNHKIDTSDCNHT